MAQSFKDFITWPLVTSSSPSPYAFLSILHSCLLFDKISFAKANLYQGQLPGAWLAIFLPDLIGRRNQQFYFSLASALFYGVWAGVAKTASSGDLIALFTLSSFAMNAGPAATTFLLPVEVFPTRV